VPSGFEKRIRRSCAQAKNRGNDGALTRETRETSERTPGLVLAGGINRRAKQGTKLKWVDPRGGPHRGTLNGFSFLDGFTIGGIVSGLVNFRTGKG